MSDMKRYAVALSMYKHEGDGSISITTVLHIVEKVSEDEAIGFSVVDAEKKCKGYRNLGVPVVLHIDDNRTTP